MRSERPSSRGARPQKRKRRVGARRLESTLQRFIQFKRYHLVANVARALARLSHGLPAVAPGAPLLGGAGMSEFSFTKLFSSITKSTVWCEPHTTVRVWITMLADCDRGGCVYAAVPGLANLARVTVQECESAIATFLAADVYSRTSDNEGRRIEVIEGGWRLLNYELYRDKRDDGARRLQNREAQQRRRERQLSSAELLTNGDERQKSAQGRGQKAEGRGQQEPKEQKRSRGSRLPSAWKPSNEELQWASNERPDLIVAREAEKFRDYWTAKAGKDATKLDWNATWRNWIRNAREEFGRSSASQRESLTEQGARLNRDFDLREGGHAPIR